MNIRNERDLIVFELSVRNLRDLVSQVERSGMAHLERMTADGGAYVNVERSGPIGLLFRGDVSILSVTAAEVDRLVAQVAEDGYAHLPFTFPIFGPVHLNVDPDEAHYAGRTPGPGSYRAGGGVGVAA